MGALRAVDSFNRAGGAWSNRSSRVTGEASFNGAGARLAPVTYHSSDPWNDHAPMLQRSGVAASP
jgi:hypothetical protein